MTELTQPIKNLIITIDEVFKDHQNDPEIAAYCRRVRTFISKAETMLLKPSETYDWKTWKAAFNESQTLQLEGNNLYYEKFRKGKTFNARESLKWIEEKEGTSERAEILKHLTNGLYNLEPE
jgi:hypothetical protein